MRNIVLICVAGLSTSMLEMKMVKAAEEQGYDCKIQAHPLNEVRKLEDPDIVLLGPQVRFQQSEIKKIFDCPVIPIEMRQYGSMDGEGVLRMAKEILGD